MSTGRDRVLFMAPQPFLEWRGSPIRVGFDVRAIAEAGYDVDLLAFPVGKDVEIPGVRIIRVPNILGVRDVRIGPSWPKAVFDGVMFFQALGLAIKNRYAVIHAVEEAGVLAYVVGRLTGARVIFEKHSDPASYRKKGLVNMVLSAYAAVETFVSRRADQVICTGPGLVEQVREEGRSDGVHHIFDIPSSLAEPDPARVEQRRAELAPQGDEVVMTYVGSFAVYQGVDLLFEAIPSIVKAHPQARFAIVGGTPERIEARRKALAAHGAEHAVSFLGLVPPDTLPDVLAASDVLVSPRLTGVNTPLKLLDYLKAGRAIVATNTLANTLLLTDELAVLTDPNPEALANGIASLITDPKHRESLAHHGRRQIDDHYNYDNFKTRLTACYAAAREGAKKKRPIRKRMSQAAGLTLYQDLCMGVSAESLMPLLF